MVQDPKNNVTQAWKYYELGRAYNNSLTPNQYRVVNTNVEFAAGNQWLNLPETASMSRLAKPTFNIIKRVTSLFVAGLTSNATTINFDTLSYYDGENISDPETNAAAYATAEVQNLFEKFRMDYRIRDALFDGAITGDYCAHFYWDADAIPYGGAFGAHRGEICMELVDGINVMFGNPNSPLVQSQPYVLLVGRDTVDNLRWEASRWKKNGKGTAENPILGNADNLIPDAETAYQIGIGGKHELMNGDSSHDKSLFVLLYTKVRHEEKLTDPNTGEVMQEPVTDKNGDPIPLKDDKGLPILDMNGKPQYKMKDATHVVTTVYATKATRNTVIYENVDTGLTLYPIAWGNWEKQKNQYHGRALVTGIIPNQIFINSMFAMVMRHLQLLGFPKTVYNADLISQWDNEIGQAIGVHNLIPGQRIGDVAYNLQPADMSNQIILAIDKAMSYTKECLGATDVQMGNVKPDNTSALMVLQSNSEVPLENVRAGLHEWIEDIGAILLDFMGTDYGERPLIRDRTFEEPVLDPAGKPRIDPMTGMMMTQKVVRRVSEDFDFSQFKHLYLNIRANVGATTYFSEIAMVQTLDNLRRDGTLDVINYLERIPDKLIPRKRELIDDLKAKMSQAQPDQQMINANPGLAGALMGGEAENQAQAADKAAQGSVGGAGAPMNGQLDKQQVIQNLPTNLSQKFDTLPNKARRALLTVQGGKG